MSNTEQTISENEAMYTIDEVLSLETIQQAYDVANEELEEASQEFQAAQQKYSQASIRVHVARQTLTALQDLTLARYGTPNPGNVTLNDTQYADIYARFPEGQIIPSPEGPSTENFDSDQGFVRFGNTPLEQDYMAPGDWSSAIKSSRVPS